MIKHATQMTNLRRGAAQPRALVRSGSSDQGDLPMERTRRSVLAATGLVGAMAVARVSQAATSAQQINRDVDRALHTLYAVHPKTRELAARAAGILVFPRIVQAGFIIGGQGGDG